MPTTFDDQHKNDHGKTLLWFTNVIKTQVINLCDFAVRLRRENQVKIIANTNPTNEIADKIML
jgi:hypothetical protein